MDDENLSVTGRPVPRIGTSASEPHWLWNAAVAAVCPLVFLPRDISRGDWIAVAAWTLVLVAGVAQSRQRVKPPVTSRKLVVAVLLASAALVFLVKDPTWRVVGLVAAVAAVLFEVAVTKRRLHAG